MRNHTATHSLEPTPTSGADAAFQALADPTRRALLALLRQGSRPAGEMASAFPVSRPAISKHLRVLRKAKLVRERRSGRHRVYQLTPDPLRAVDRWLEDYRALWSGKLAALKAFVEADVVGKPESRTRRRSRGGQTKS